MNIINYYEIIFADPCCEHVNVFSVCGTSNTHPEVLGDYPLTDFNDFVEYSSSTSDVQILFASDGTYVSNSAFLMFIEKTSIYI